MARKRHSDEDWLKLLREIELQLAAGSDVPSACRAAASLNQDGDNERSRDDLTADASDNDR